MKHKITKQCDNVTIIKIGKTTVKVWSNSKGDDAPNLNVEVDGNIPTTLSIVNQIGGTMLKRGAEWRP